jgi:ribose-phosphate pyrophosphokinase
VQRITDSPLQHVIVTNTIPQTETAAACAKVRVKSVGRLLGEAIKRIHHGDSISSLFV